MQSQAKVIKLILKTSAPFSLWLSFFQTSTLKQIKQFKKQTHKGSYIFHNFSDAQTAYQIQTFYLGFYLVYHDLALILVPFIYSGI